MIKLINIKGVFKHNYVLGGICGFAMNIRESFVLSSWSPWLACATLVWLKAAKIVHPCEEARKLFGAYTFGEWTRSLYYNTVIWCKDNGGAENPAYSSILRLNKKSKASLWGRMWHVRLASAKGFELTRYLARGHWNKEGILKTFSIDGAWARS